MSSQDAKDADLMSTISQFRVCSYYSQYPTSTDDIFTHFYLNMCWLLCTRLGREHITTNLIVSLVCSLKRRRLLFVIFNETADQVSSLREILTNKNMVTCLLAPSSIFFLWIKFLPFTHSFPLSSPFLFSDSPPSVSCHTNWVSTYMSHSDH